MDVTFLKVNEITPKFQENFSGTCNAQKWTLWVKWGVSSHPTTRQDLEKPLMVAYTRLHTQTPTLGELVPIRGP